MFGVRYIVCKIIFRKMIDSNLLLNYAINKIHYNRAFEYISELNTNFNKICQFEFSTRIIYKPNLLLIKKNQNISIELFLPYVEGYLSFEKCLFNINKIDNLDLLFIKGRKISIVFINRDIVYYM